jgi:hypothetical protein
MDPRRDFGNSIVAAMAPWPLFFPSVRP